MYIEEVQKILAKHSSYLKMVGIEPVSQKFPTGSTVIISSKSRT